MQCPECKAEIPDDSVFCHECGARLSSGEGEGRQAARQVGPAAPVTDSGGREQGQGGGTQTYTMRYTGSGVDIFGRVILGSILTVLTLGLYFPWFVNNIIRYVCERAVVANPPPGTSVQVSYTGSGVDLFGRFILWYILTFITLGLYGPWAANGFYGYIVQNIAVTSRR